MDIRRHNSSASEVAGSYSHATIVNDLVFVSGQVAADAHHRTVVLGDIKDETRAAMELIQIILGELGLTFLDAVKLSIFMSNTDVYDEMNEVYSSFFPSRQFPARTCVGVHKILCGCQIEIECIAKIPSKLKFIVITLLPN
jgi:2-iminobutanoate/2-iminopropanoate deaminase